MILFLMTLFVNFSRADDFSQHAVPTSAITCKKLDYSSYFVAQNSESSIKQSNPDVSKPNFGGKYLFLKNELMMEIVWLIADCETGKFFHEKITGRNAEFKPDSLLVIMTIDRGPKEYQVWTDDSWNRIDLAPVEEGSHPAATPAVKTSAAKKEATPAEVKTEATPAPVLQQTLVMQYDSFFKKFPTTPSTATCKELDYNSYFKVQQAKTNIQKLNKDFSHANFAGHYLLLKNDMMFETIWVIADCETGKFLPVFISGRANFKPDSALVVLKQSNDYPELKFWQDQQWYSIANPNEVKRSSVKNMLYGAKAKTLYDALPHAGKADKIRFDQIDCTAQGCKVDLYKAPGTEISPAHTAALSDLIHTFGAQTLDGLCEVKSGEPQCEINSK